VNQLAHAIEQLHQADRQLLSLEPRPLPVPLRGLEAVVAGTVSALRDRDWWVPGLRERAGAVLRGVEIDQLARGTGGSRQHRVAPIHPSPALRALHAVGIALADPGCAAVVHLGIGSAADGAFHEALNLAALLRPDVVFVVAVHPLGDDAPVGPQLAARPVDLARAFGLPAMEVDGSRAPAVHEAVRQALGQGGPHLIEARLHPGADLRARAGATPPEQELP